ncbi:MAG: pitrilysin family protein [Desulfuromonadaceae bacterium]|nr:pitrilysin family protein [Desulfuromonadaceae bacterium]MDD5104002.1 pitrilysin family protein [Desulfuromonadaceae bacterium]
MRLLLSLCVLFTMSAYSSAADQQWANPRTMSFPALNFQIPTAERVVLDCGMPVYLLRDTELPIITMSAMVRVGGVYEPTNKSGLAGMTGSIMRSGGAGGMHPEAIDDELEFMASAVESGISTDMGTVSLAALKKNFSRTLQIFRNVLLSPDFNEKRIEIARRQTIEGLRRQNDDPKEIAGREINRAVFAGHQLGRVTTYETVKAITREDLVEFHRRFYRLDNMILAVSGDFERAALLKELNSVFKPVAYPTVLILPTISQPQQLFQGEVLYGKKQVNQTVIRMGHLGLDKDAPDIYAVRLLDYILGGSFTSRLTTEIRTNQGLAYNIDSRFDIGRRYTGSFIAETETKAESTIKTINLMKKLITELTKEPVSTGELKAAQEYIINSFMFGFTSPATIVSQRARLEYYGYPDGYLEQYRDNIAKVTKNDILHAARKYLHPDAFKLVIIGDATKFDQPLASLGQVRELDLKQNIPK